MTFSPSRDLPRCRAGIPPFSFHQIISSGCYRGLLQDLLIVAFVLGDDVVGAEFLAGVDSSLLAHFAATVGAGKDFKCMTRGAGNVSGFDEKTVDALLNDFRNPAGVGGDNRNFASHCFQSRETKRFQL